MKRSFLFQAGVVLFAWLYLSGGIGLSVQLWGGGFGTLEVPAYRLATDRVIQAHGGGCGLSCCCTGSSAQESGRYEARQEARSVSRRRGVGAASGGDEPPEWNPDSKKPSYDEMLLEMQRIWQLLSQLLRARNSFLVLCLDIDRTVYYPGASVGFQSACSENWASHLNRLRRERRLLLIYNTIRTPGSLSFSDRCWPCNEHPEPDILIMDGRHVELNPRLQENYPHLQVVLSPQSAAISWPSLEEVGISDKDYMSDSGSCCRALCHPGDQVRAVRERIESYCSGQCRILQRSFAGGAREMVFAFDPSVTKGYALSQVINQLDQQHFFGSNPVLLITAGDDVPDVSMMNPQMSFPADGGADSFVAEWPYNVQRLFGK